MTHGDLFLLQNLSNSKIKDISGLTGVRHLKADNNANLKKVILHTQVLKTPDMSHCKKLTSIVGLESVQSLTLTHCAALEKAGEWGHIPEINLHECTKLRDVSSLGNVKDLNLRSGKGMGLNCGTIGHSDSSFSPQLVQAAH